MITLAEIIDLSLNYKVPFLKLNRFTINNIILQCAKDAKKLVKPGKETYPFFHYIVTAYLDNKPCLYTGARLKKKIEYIKETILEIQRVWNLPHIQDMLDFLQEVQVMKLPYKGRFVGWDTIIYTFNKEKYLDNFLVYCELSNLSYTIEKDKYESPYTLTINFSHNETKEICTELTSKN